MATTRRKARTERYVVVKEPDVKVLFTKTIERFKVGEKAQLTIQGAPETQKSSVDITAYYVRQIGTLRLYVGSTPGGWGMPLAVEPNTDYQAVTLALDETIAIEAGLPDFATPEEATTAWKARMRDRSD
jgi:hypothetical protein